MATAMPIRSTGTIRIDSAQNRSVFLSNGNGSLCRYGRNPRRKRFHFFYQQVLLCRYQWRWKSRSYLAGTPQLNSGHTLVYLATSGGNFSATAVDNPEGTSAGTTTLYNFADVNGDGKADKIYWNSTFDDGHYRVYT